MRISARQIASGLIACAAFINTPLMASSQERDPDPFYCGERDLGRYFYCDRHRQQAEPDEPTVVEIIAAPPTAIEEMSEIQDTLKELRTEAVLRPTADNVRAYIVYQRQQLDRASAFSDSWRRLLWTEPSLDYTLQRPVSQLGKRQWLDERREDRGFVLANLGERYGLFYFFAASCSACTEFSPILRAFADRHDIPVKAVSVDGGPSPYFPEAVRDAGQMAALGLSGAPTPAVALYDSHANKVIPIGFGIVSQSELEDRIFVLTQTQPGEDY
ncbi:MAG: conjugal transfer protein TraF [Pseudomonadota bacterium]